MPKPGILLCGVAITDGKAESPIVIGAITSCSGFGASRQAVPNIHNDVTGGWAEVLMSCIRMMKPFRVGIVHQSNSTSWKTLLTQAMSTFAITWPIEDGYTTGAVYSFKAAVTDYEAGAGDIESRVNAMFTITPSGEPTITAGTVDD